MTIMKRIKFWTCKSEMPLIKHLNEINFTRRIIALQKLSIKIC